MTKTHRREQNRQRYTNKAEQILQGALPEFLKHGYACTSMDRVATAAGVSKQTLYSYYKDKNGLFTALIEYIACHKFKLVGAKNLISSCTILFMIIPDYIDIKVRNK